MKRATWLSLAVAVVLLAGCGGDDDEQSSAERAIRSNLLRLATAWQYEDTGPFYTYYSEDYDFDEMGKDDHLQSIFADFPYIRDWHLSKYEINVQDSTYALVRMHFSMELYADVSSLDYPTTIERWVESKNEILQVWKRDFDGVWRVAAEYLAAAWVLRNSPDIRSLSVVSGDQFHAGSAYGISALGLTNSGSYRVTLWPDCYAADYFDPDYAYGWAAADYYGDFAVRDAAYGEYALSFIGQTDRPPEDTMVGRRIEAEYVVVYDSSGQKPVRQYRAPTGTRKSVFRLMRIHGSAGQTPREEPRPG